MSGANTVAQVVPLLDEIRQLEGRIPNHLEVRTRHGIPQLDGCPTPALERYVAELRQAANPFAWVDQAWQEAATRTGGARFNVWTGRGRSGRHIGSWATLPPARRAAEEHRPARVFDGFELVAKVPKLTKAFLALVERVKALGQAPDGTPLRSLRMTPKRAERLVAFLAAGEVRSGQQAQKVEKVNLRIEIEGGRGVVRRDAAGQPEPTKPKRTRRKS